MTRLTLPPPSLTLLAAALVALVLALPAGEVHAQTKGQAACPAGVMHDVSPEFDVVDVKHDRATLRGVLEITKHDINGLAEVTVDRGRGWNSATLYTGVRGYGYAADARDARSFGETIVQVQDGDLIHGVWLHAGRVADSDLTIRPSTVLGLEPSTTYVAQLVVGELRNFQGEIVTNQFVSGTANSVGNKPKPVLREVCFQTAAPPS